MAFRARSTEGCWTCRLRKKKCDEKRPLCSQCTSLALPCHGYCSKPEWMDGREREREMADHIRRLVKMTAGKNRRAAMLRRGTTPRSAGVARGSAAVASGMQSEVDSLEALDPEFANERSVGVMENGRAVSIPEDSLLSLPFVADDDQTSLLMHYLDHVFPLQFPFYKSSVRNGGRGWVLSMLTQTRPLYHAALSLAAYHRQFVSSQRTSEIERRLQMESLQQKHVLAITELRRFLLRVNSSWRDRSIVENVQLLCCMVLLISLERYIDSAGDWRVHLRGATALMRDIKRVAMQRTPETLPPTYDAALFFFSGVILWYDTLSCATTGLKPFTNCDCAVAGEGYLPLDHIMGCENWAMVCIMEIAYVDGVEDDFPRTYGNWNMDDVPGRVRNIRRHLESGLQRYSAMEDEMDVNSVGAENSEPGDTDQSPSPVDTITRIFACAALVYLHVVASGPDPRNESLQDKVNRTMIALQNFSNRKIVGALSWPVCIAGCMASTKEQQESFRDFSMNELMVNPMFGDSSKVLSIMQECWRVREQRSGEECNNDWRTSMKTLDMHVLLA